MQYLSALGDTSLVIKHIAKLDTPEGKLCLLTCTCSNGTSKAVVLNVVAGTKLHELEQRIHPTLYNSS